MGMAPGASAGVRCVTATREELAGQALSARRSTLAVAESCTGGLLGARVTSVSGSSAYFAGGVIAYSNAAKQSLLGVDGGVLGSEGAVSEPVARQMAEGARQRLGTTYGIGVTGIAGPGGAVAGKPVGTVYIAVAGPHAGTVRRSVFPGGRQEVRAAACEAALQMLLDVMGSEGR